MSEEDQSKPAAKEGTVSNNEKPRVVSAQDIRTIRNKIRASGRGSLTPKERDLAVSLGVIKEPKTLTKRS